ncbi:hypothetical protein BJY01DRAFT_251761 [Aspergillus pseudoustus]|uniref:BTB domain-containing protein n=1 Tax=Aspergillus pseudoustus TaxID=1810923 RepID=A0ABR4JAU5_9EURO
MLTVLKPKIRRCLPNADELEKLLPEILAARQASTYIEDILEQCTINGYLESYKVIAPEVFSSPEKYKKAINNAFADSVQRHHNEIAEDILEGFSLFPTPRDRRILLSLSLERALSVPNAKLAKKIIQTYLNHEKVPIWALSTPLMKACQMDQRECVRLLVEYIVRTRNQLSANVPMWSNRGRVAYRECGGVLEAVLWTTIKCQFHHLTELLLFPYLECIPYLLKSPNVSADILRNVRDEEFAAIPRKKCVGLLLHPLTGVGRNRLARRLQETESEPADLRLTAQGKTFTAHKDVLAFHSEYFSSLFRGSWKDRDHVTFDDEDISAAVLELIVDFSYGRRYRVDARTVDDEDLLAAVDYFLMEGLKHDIEDCIPGLKFGYESSDDDDDGDGDYDASSSYLGSDLSDD